MFLVNYILSQRVALSLSHRTHVNLDWHGARIQFLARFLAALITTRTVNLAPLACVFDGEAQPDAHYERCRRFLKDFALPYAERARFIVAVLGVQEGWTLAVDRTNWKLGQAELNFLVLAIGQQGTAYPVVWFLLDKAGNSHTDERLLLRELFLRLFGKDRIATLVADRELVGKAWLAWLSPAELPFQIRVQESFQATYRGRQGALRDWFRHATPERPLCFNRPCQMWGGAYYLSGCRLPTGAYLILVSPTYEPAALTNWYTKNKVPLQSVRVSAECGDEKSTASTHGHRTRRVKSDPRQGDTRGQDFQTCHGLA